MKKIIYTSPYIPAEFIYAHDFTPLRIFPECKEMINTFKSQMGVCPFTKFFVNDICSNHPNTPIIFTTSCDQMRRASEIISLQFSNPVFLFNLPSTWETKTAQNIYISELKRLSKFLLNNGGIEPTKEELIRTMIEFEHKRNLLRKSKNTLSPREFNINCLYYFDNDILEENQKVLLHNYLIKPMDPQLTKDNNKIPLALVGDSLLKSCLEIFDIIEKFGGKIIIDATGSGERILPTPFSQQEIYEDPYKAFMKSYLFGITDIFQRPNIPFYNWLNKNISEKKIKGIIYYHYTWCDKWGAEAAYFRKSANCPVLTIEFNDEYPINMNILTQIESFIEILK